MRARDIKVGEVGGIRLVEVVVAFCEGGVGCCDGWEEECRGGYLLGDNAFVNYAMPYYGIEDSSL